MANPTDEAETLEQILSTITPQITPSAATLKEASNRKIVRRQNSTSGRAIRGSYTLFSPENINKNANGLSAQFPIKLELKNI